VKPPQDPTPETTAAATASAAHEASQAAGSRWHRALVLVGIVVLAFNLRPAAVSVGPLLDEISSGLHMHGAEAAVLTTLPVICFATIGALAPRLGQLVGLHRLIFVALLSVLLGLAARAHVGSPLPFLVLSFVSLAGMAAANVLLPSLVKLHFPDRVGQVTALYSTALAVGLTAASTLTVPIAESGPGTDWRHGLEVWALTAGVAAVPWIGLLRGEHRGHSAGEAIRGSQVARTRLGWAMAVFFGLQSLQAYSIFGWFADIFRDHGYSAHTAGLLLGVITGVTIPLSWVVPQLTARIHHPWVLLTFLMACYLVGYVGLLVAPHSGAWAWAAIIGTGSCRTLGLLPVRRLPHRDRRTVQRRGAARRHRRLDRAAAVPAGAVHPPVRRRPGRHPAALPGGRAPRGRPDGGLTLRPRRSASAWSPPPPGTTRTGGCRGAAPVRRGRTAP
jgi:CP family cyanate transporter-like MFS transporter